MTRRMQPPRARQRVSPRWGVGSDQVKNPREIRDDIGPAPDAAETAQATAESAESTSLEAALAEREIVSYGGSRLATTASPFAAHVDD